MKMRQGTGPWMNKCGSQGAVNNLETILSYSPMLQFVLLDKKKRLFKTRRYCFLGSIDDWITIGTVNVLPELVKAYVKHLGEESYYKLY